MLAQQISEYICAGFPGIFIESHEHFELNKDLEEICKKMKWSMKYWDCFRGYNDSKVWQGNKKDLLEVNALLNAIVSEVESKILSNQDDNTAELLVLYNFHYFLGNPSVIQRVQHIFNYAKRTGNCLIFVSPTSTLPNGSPCIPKELERQIVMLEHNLPSREDLYAIVKDIQPDFIKKPALEQKHILDASAGLTRLQAENAFSLSMVRHKDIQSDAIWEIKSGELKKSNLMEMYKGEEDFKSIGGLNNLKDYCFRALMPSKERKAKAKGCLLVGVPGVGKTLFAKALGKETLRPTLLLDFASLMGSLVGQTESQLKQALKIADAMSPCILFADEIEKMFAGADASGSTDSGVTARAFGCFLTWLNDHTSDVFFIATSNNLSGLQKSSQGAFTRAGRFNATFFIDIPNDEERKPIWNICAKAFDIDLKQDLPDDHNWTGAEIKGCCEQASLLDISLIEASQYIVPVFVTAEDQINKLRESASKKYLDASNHGLYNAQNLLMKAPVKKTRKYLGQG